MLGKIFKVVVDVALTPVEIVKDVASVGGAATGQRKPYTLQHLDKIAEDLDEIA